MLLLLVRLRSRLRAVQTVLEGRGCEAIATCRGVNRKIWNALKSGLSIRDTGSDIGHAIVPKLLDEVLGTKPVIQIGEVRVDFLCLGISDTFSQLMQHIPQPSSPFTMVGSMLGAV